MKRLAGTLSIFGVLLIIFVWSILIAPGQAAPLAQESTPIPNLSIGDDYCLSCHGEPGQTMPLEDGSELDLYVDPQEHANSIHGSLGYACVQCHNDVGEYPHPPFSAADQRDVTLQLNQVCERCHTAQFELAHDSVHNQALQEGNRNAAVCTDCHTAHAVEQWVDPETGETLPEARIRIPQTCAQCHSAIYETYLTSVHGTALTETNNPDVPTCIDCHGVHSIEDPTTTQFRLASPQLCAKCHTDPARMNKYGISTDVLDTYVADFHGTTVTIFEKQSPDAETNKPVCYDCHGVHDIKRADDPEKGLQVQENILATCQKCHPDAQENFSAAWLSHYIPSPERYPIVYYVDLFYRIFIPTVLGGMSLLVVMDASRRGLNTYRQRQARKLAAMPAEGVSESVTQVEAKAQAAAPVSPAEEVTTTVQEPGEAGAAPGPEFQSKPGEAGEPTLEPDIMPSTTEPPAQLEQESPLPPTHQAVSAEDVDLEAEGSPAEDQARHDEQELKNTSTKKPDRDSSGQEPENG